MQRVCRAEAFVSDSLGRLDAMEKTGWLSVESHGEARGRMNRLEGGIAIIQAQIADIQAQVREMDPVDERVKTAVDMITGVLDSLQKRVATLEGEDAPGEGTPPPETQYRRVRQPRRPRPSGTSPPRTSSTTTSTAHGA